MIVKIVNGLRTNIKSVIKSFGTIDKHHTINETEQNTVEHKSTLY